MDVQRPLYIFDLPEEILATLTLKSNGTPPVSELVQEGERRQKGEMTAEPGDATPTKATSCNLCGLSFGNVQEQRSHVKSDLHTFNLKQKQRGQKAVDEAEFERLIGELNESLSGSESSTSETDDDDPRASSEQTPLSTLLRQQANISAEDAEDISSRKRKRGAGKPPLIWFTSSTLPENTSLGIYRAVFSNAEQLNDSGLVDAVRKKQLTPSKAPNSASKSRDGGVPLPNTDIGPHYFLCMIGGGHFAAMVIALTPKLGKKHTGATERQATVIAHKTFHRYTTRRKQGGAQSANDNAKGNAHSAGSSLRRYNEVALTNEVRELLGQWEPMIDTADQIFIRATGNTNRQTLFGPYERQVLRQDDPRNRGFPFSTRRATQAELMRCFVELTRVKVSHVDEAALAAAEAAAIAADGVRGQNEGVQKGSTPRKGVEATTKTKAEEIAELHTSQIIPLVRRAKVPALLTYLSSNDLTPSFEFCPPSSQQHHHAPTPLHLAASINSAVLVSALLTKAGGDPTKLNGDGRAAFELAGDRATRDAFRVARHELGESKWNWDAAMVPPALSKADANERAAREKEEEAAETAKETARRKTELDRLRAESEKADVEKQEKRLGKGKTLSGVPEKTGAEKREEESRGMTPEMRQRLERERRARAAEERIRRMQQGN